MSAARRLADRVQAALAQTHDLPSPCVSVCRMQASQDLCHGCFRQLNEIAAWGTMDDAAKRAVWTLIGQRLKAT